MTESKNDQEAVKIDLLKHLCMVSLLSMIFMVGQFDHENSLWAQSMLKIVAFLFLVSVVSAITYLFVAVANLQLPENSPNRKIKDERNIQRKSIILSIASFLLGYVVFFLYVCFF